MSLSILVDSDLVEQVGERAIEHSLSLETRGQVFSFTGLYYACHQRGV